MNMELYEQYKAAQGDEAKKLLNLLMKQNTHLVKRCVSSLCRKLSVETEDLFQHGMMGLLTAINKFESSKGSWAPYARLWIADAVQKALPDQDVIRIPKKRPRVSKAQMREAQAIKARTGRDATATELRVPEETWKMIKAPKICVDLDKFAVVEETAGQVDMVDCREDMRRAVAALDPRSQRIVLGLHVEEKTLLEVANEEGISDCYVSMLRDAAMKKMRRRLEMY